MIYEFSHYPTDDGRRVRFVIPRAELDAMRRAGYLGSDELRGVAINQASASGDTVLTMTPAEARAMVDALSMVGGEAAVSARMLSGALDGMAQELRASRGPSMKLRPGFFRLQHGI